jgi:hypothetical protein
MMSARRAWGLLALLAFAACGQEPPEAIDPVAGYEAYGDTLTPEGAVPVQAVAAEPGTYAGRAVKVEGTVVEVCQMKGCWVTLDAGDGTLVRVGVARTDAGDYAFTLPTDLSGRRVVVEGVLEEAILTADVQQHLAEDAGTPLTEMPQDRPELQLTARGVLVQKALALAPEV